MFRARGNEVIHGRPGNDQGGMRIVDKNKTCGLSFNFAPAIAKDRNVFKIIVESLTESCIIFEAARGGRFRYSYANQAGYVIAGIKPEAIGCLLEEAHGPEEAAAIRHILLNALEGRKPAAAGFGDLRFPAELASENTAIIPIRNEEGEPFCLAALITGENTLHARLRKAREESQMLRSVIEHNNDGILAVSIKGEILSANQAAGKIIGYPEKQIKGRSVYNLLGDSDISLLQKALIRAVNGYFSELEQYRLIHKNGKQFIVFLKTVPMVADLEVKGIYVIIRDITEEAKAADMVDYVMHHDQLTGLKNRKSLMKDLDAAIASAREKHSKIALLYIDLDRFKLINDTIGHIQGDLLLKQVGSRLKSVEGENYKVYRVGGDEFVVVLSHTSQKEVLNFAARIFSSFKDSVLIGQHDCFITPSIGISMFPFDGEDSGTLMKKADGALSQVKQRGKAHYQFYSADFNKNSSNLVMIERHLRRAIERNELLLYFQPQFDLRSGKITSFEALLRWNSPVLGFVSPADFIPVAEDTGLIIPIGEWVLEEVCKVIVEWERKGYTALKVAVNLSPKQFLQPNLCSKIDHLLKKYRVRTECLGIEITEGAMQDTGEALEILKCLKKLGISISIDDFGTGYSSLSYIKQFPLDTLKIDQSFIRDVLSDKKDAAITSTIIHLAHSLGLEVIAEGVETEEQAEFLKNADCEKAQGFWYSRAIPIKEVEMKYFIS